MSIAGVQQDSHTARKDYTCDGCGKPIYKGAVYIREHRPFGPPDMKFHPGGELGGYGCERENKPSP